MSMLWVYDHYKYFIFLSAGIVFYTSESNVYWRQIVTYKDDPRAERVNTNTWWYCYVEVHLN